MSPLDIPGLLERYPTLSHAVWGSFGAVAYVLFSIYERKVIWGWREVLARIVLATSAAILVTSIPGVPNHITSAFVGFSGIVVWQAIGNRLEQDGISWLITRGNGSIPGHFTPVVKDDLDAAVQARVVQLRAESEVAREKAEQKPFEMDHRR